jgi:cytochrome P450
MVAIADGSNILALLVGEERDAVGFVAELRAHDPICWLPGLDAWLVTRYDDVRALFVHPQLTADPRAYQRYQPPTEPGAARWLDEMPFRSTPSDPSSLGRRLVSAAMTPRATERAEHRVREVVEQFAAPLRGRRGVVDLIGEFTSPVAATVIGRILGVPPKGDDEARFQQMARNATRAIRPVLSDEKRKETERASVEMCEYVLGLVEERRESPRDDLISDLVTTSRDDQSASTEDIVRVISALVSAGTGTTGTACARALRTLLQHPGEMALLRDDRSLLPNAIGELLRYDSGLLVMPRYVVETFEMCGRTFETGQLVVLCLMGANHDPEVFADPDELDLRRDTSEAISFGQGPHYCIGANLARVELRWMLDAALDFIPTGARLLESEIRWSPRGLMSQIKSLPVDFTP